MNKSYYKNQKDESIKSPESYLTNNKARESSEESFDIGEESIANEREITNKPVRNIPKEQEPSKFMHTLNST